MLNVLGLLVGQKIFQAVTMDFNFSVFRPNRYVEVTVYTVYESNKQNKSHEVRKLAPTSAKH